MKTAIKWMLAMVLAMFTAVGVSALAEPAEEPAEWTVLFYFCGSDLESKYSYATGNLQEIGGVQYPDSYLSIIARTFGKKIDPDAIPAPPKVNVLIQTGGSREWHAQELGLDIDEDAIQRWQYRCYSLYGDDSINDYLTGFELMETNPLQNMADPATLAEFIRWGAKTCPAKKYALVLWDHGGGAKTGLFIDELFDNDVIPIRGFARCPSTFNLPDRGTGNGRAAV